MGARKRYKLDLFQSYPEEDMSLYVKQLLAKMENGHVNSIEKDDGDDAAKLHSFCNKLIEVCEKERSYPTQLEALAAGSVMSAVYSAALGRMGFDTGPIGTGVTMNEEGGTFKVRCTKPDQKPGVPSKGKGKGKP